MACEYICDGCGERAPAENYRTGYFKPRDWYQRSDENGTQVACSRECIDRVATTSGATRAVLPL